MALVDFVVNFVLVLVVLFYFMRDWNRLMLRIAEMVPRRWHPQFVSLFGEIDGVLGQFCGPAAGHAADGRVLHDRAVAGRARLCPVRRDDRGPADVRALPGVITGVALATLTGILQFDSYADSCGCGAFSWPATCSKARARAAPRRRSHRPASRRRALRAARFRQLFGFFGVLLAVPRRIAARVAAPHARRYLDSGMYNA